MSGNSAEVREKPKVRKRSGNLCSQGNWITAVELYRQIAELKSVKYLHLLSADTCELCINCDVHGHVLRSSYNLPVLYLHWSTWCSQIIWINKCAFVHHIACSFV